MIDKKISETLLKETINWREQLRKELEAGHLSLFAKHFVDCFKGDYQEFLNWYKGSMDEIDKGFEMLDQVPDVAEQTIIKRRLVFEGEQKRRELNTMWELGANMRLVISEMDEMIEAFEVNHEE